MTSGRSSNAFSMASSPSAAVATRNPRNSRYSAKISRPWSTSSTTSTSGALAASPAGHAVLGFAGQIEGERGALAEPADQGDAAVEELGEAAADRQAEPGATLARGRRSCWPARRPRRSSSGSPSAMPMPVSVTAIEISPVPRSCSRRMATDPSGVNFRAFDSRLSTICLTFWRSVSISGSVGGRSRVDRQPGAGDHRLDLGHHLVDQLGQADALDLHRHLARLDAGDVQEVVDDGEQVAGVGVDPRQLVLLRRLSVRPRPPRAAGRCSP